MPPALRFVSVKVGLVSLRIVRAEPELASASTSSSSWNPRLPYVKYSWSLDVPQRTSFHIVSVLSQQHDVFTASCGGRFTRVPFFEATSKTQRSYFGITESPGSA